MNTKTKTWLNEILESEGGDIERAAKWMARNFRAIGGIKFFREQLTEAAK